MSTTPGEASVDPADPAGLCDRAAALAAAGDLAEAAALFRRAMDESAGEPRARAALGLAVVLDDAGDPVGARAADRAAIETGDPEYAPRAGYHLALAHEAAGEPAEAAAAWRRVLEFRNPRYLPPALLALARLADDAGDFEHAREQWLAAIDAGDPWCAADAAHDLARRLLDRGEPAAARRVLTAGLRQVDRDRAPDAHARLAAAIGIAYLDQAIGAFDAALADAAAADDGEIAALATELLARTLPLRDRGDEAAQVWSHGLADPLTADRVRARLRRDFAEPTPDPEPGPAAAWWEPALEDAAVTGTVPVLAAEAFEAVGRMHRLATGPDAAEPVSADGPAPGTTDPASAAAGGPPSARSSGASAESLARVAAVPDRYDWGAALRR